MDRDFSVKPNDAEKPQLIGINDIKMPKSEPTKPESIELPISKENAKSAKKKGESYVNS